jgi:hypothetical protein
MVDAFYIDSVLFNCYESGFMGRYSQFEQTLVSIYNLLDVTSDTFTLIFPFKEYTNWIWFNDAHGLVTSDTIHDNFKLHIDTSYMEYLNEINNEKDDVPWIDGGCD